MLINYIHLVFLMQPKVGNAMLIVAQMSYTVLFGLVVPTGWLQSVIGNQLSTWWRHFCVTFSIPNSIGGRCTGDSGYVAKAGDLNHRLVVIRQFSQRSGTQVTENCCTRSVRFVPVFLVPNAAASARLVATIMMSPGCKLITDCIYLVRTTNPTTRWMRPVL